MDTDPVSAIDQPARGLRRWMRAVGVLYLLLGAASFPPLVEARFTEQYGDLGIEVTAPAAQALVDVWFMFGLEIFVLGAALLLFSRAPERSTALVWTVLGLELVRGIVVDLYFIARGHDAVFYSAFALLHLVVIVTGVVALRRAQRSGAARLAELVR